MRSIWSWTTLSALLLMLAAVEARLSPANVIQIPQPTRPPLQIPRQCLEIDIPSGKNNSDSLPPHIDLPFLNRSVWNSC